jgi:hypothetical protein
MKRFIRFTPVLRPSYYTYHRVFTQPRPLADTHIIQRLMHSIFEIRSIGDYG